MKIATVAIIVKDGKVLLGYKKKGEIGTDTLNGPGGKCEPGETPAECVIRETEEELGIQLAPELLSKVAEITFYANGTPDFAVHFFRTGFFRGEPRETADMVPEWHDANNLPFGRMLESDRAWFGKVVSGEPFSANVFYKNRASGFERIEFLPPNF